jgi:hypothetical protein
MPEKEGIDPAAWTVTAVNLPEHAGNPIHTDAGARAAGFAGALVAGVTTYAYLTHPLVAAWGLEWVEGGGGELRLVAPVFAGDVVTCRPARRDDRWQIDACCQSEPVVRATLTAIRHGRSASDRRDGEPLTTLRVRLTDEWESYGRRLGDDLDVYDREGVVHPAVWPALANRVVHDQLARGSWIHVRSRIDHHGLARVGAEAVVEGVVIERRYRRSGEWAIVGVTIDAGGRLVASVEHEAILALS